MEVLGSVLGTAIQGQIVGKVDTPCVEGPLFTSKPNSSVAMEELNMTHDTGSLTDTVSQGWAPAGSPRHLLPGVLTQQVAGGSLSPHCSPLLHRETPT